ncbi:MAG TPA: sulfite exporter TauE/SafE family protein, partial [Gammaproteobacteria bacterium]|nr:sulfite exporter TauE/SafE family protein [Gammaproteobacteria bacterium]
GVGGGLIIVPVLAALFALHGVASDVIMHLALGTSLASIAFTSLSSLRAHQKHHAILWPAFRQLTPGILLGAAFGGWLAGMMTTAWLKPLFAVFELGVALHMLSSVQTHAHRSMPGWAGMSGAGGIIGLVSSLVGIGGGTLTVPWLAWNSVPLRQAIATSAACGFPIAVAGSLSYIVNGWQHASLPTYTLGYVHLPAFIGIVISSVLFAPLGARLTHSLPVPILKKIFGGLLLLLGIKLLLSEI